MPIKRIKRAFKKITKPVARVLDKVVPNEIKPALPYLAAVAPYAFGPGVVGASGFQGILANPIARASLMGGLNLGAQLSQEGSEGEFSGISTLLAGLQGFGTAAGADQYLQDLRTPMAGEEGFTGLGAIKSRAIDIGQKGVDVLQGAGEVLRDPFNQSLGEVAKAAAIPFTQGSADLGMATARKALQDYEAELAAFNAQAGADQEASDSARRAAIIASMTRADFTQDIIDETLGQLGLKDGGIARLGFDNGGDVEGIMRVSEIKKAPKDDYDFNDPSWWEQQILKDLNFYKTNSLDASPFNMAYMMNAVNEYSKLGGDSKRAKELANMVQNFINEDAAKFQSLSEEEKKQRITRDKESLDRQLEETGRTAPPGFANPDGIEYTRDIEFKEVKDGGIIGLRNGGRIGFDNGGDVSFGGITEAVKNVEQKPRKFLVDKLEVTQEPGQSEMRAIIEAMYNDIDDVMPEDRKREFYQLYAPQMLRKGEMDDTEFKFIQTEILGKKMKKGGIASLKDGGIMNLGGKEMDMRTGGFIPIGAKERADDVPARLSKNEFVMTADAVRAAGGGSVNKGAKRMYDLMHNLEARA